MIQLRKWEAILLTVLAPVLGRLARSRTSESERDRADSEVR